MKKSDFVSVATSVVTPRWLPKYAGLWGCTGNEWRVVIVNNETGDELEKIAPLPRYPFRDGKMTEAAAQEAMLSGNILDAMLGKVKSLVKTLYKDSADPQVRADIEIYRGIYTAIKSYQ